MTFEATSVRKKGKEWVATGKLNIKGVEKEVEGVDRVDRLAAAIVRANFHIFVILLLSHTTSEECG